MDHHRRGRSPMLDRSLSSGQRRSHIVGNMIDGFSTLRKQWLVALKHMKHARPDFQLHRNSVCTSLLRHADGVFAEHLVFPNLNQQRRKTTVVTEYRRGQRVAGICLPQVVIAKHGHRVRTDDGIVDGSQGFTRQGPIGGWRESNCPRRERSSTVPQCQQRRQSQVAAGGIAGNECGFGGRRTDRSVRDQPFVSANTILKPGRKGCSGASR